MSKSAAIEVPRLVELFGLKPGATIADVGAGFGAWTVANVTVLAGAANSTNLPANAVTRC